MRAVVLTVFWEDVSFDIGAKFRLDLFEILRKLLFEFGDLFEMIDCEKTLAEKSFIIGKLLKLFQDGFEFWVVEKHFIESIASFAVFTGEMLASVVDNFFERKVAKIAQAISISSTKHDVDINITVCGSDDLAVNTARRVVTMRAMIFNRFSDDFDFGGSEELLQILILAQHFSGNLFMMCGVDMVPKVVISGNCIDDVGVEFFARVVLSLFGKLEATTNDIVNVTDLVTPFVLGILRQNVGF